MNPLSSTLMSRYQIHHAAAVVLLIISSSSHTVLILPHLSTFIITNTRETQSNVFYDKVFTKNDNLENILIKLNNNYEENIQKILFLGRTKKDKPNIISLLKDNLKNLNL